MKICPDCQGGNTDAAISCTSCGRSLLKVETIDEAEMLERDLATIDRSEKWKKRWLTVIKAIAACVGAVVLAFAIWTAAINIDKVPVFILVICLIMESIGFFLLLLPRSNGLWYFFFIGEIGWVIQNPGNAEPSDSFYTRYRIIGAAIIILGIIYIFIISG